MYKLVITTGKGPSRKVESKVYWMTQTGLHQAEEQFERLTHRANVMELRLWRQDLQGTHELKRWVRNDNG